MLGELDPEEAIQRAHEIVEVVPVLSDDMISDIYASDGFLELSGIDNIDGGEQILAAILLKNPTGQVLLSGDKRFVRAFRENLPERWETLKGAIISFEICLLAVEKQFGFEYILERAYPVRCCDGSLRLAMGEVPTASTFKEALTSFDPCRVEIPREK